MKILSFLSFLLFGFFLRAVEIQPKYYSQYQQDKWLYENIFKNNTNGFFVDIGASDGIKFSNTYFFEKMLGWNGVCVEPLPDIYKRLIKNRNCICINGC